MMEEEVEKNLMEYVPVDDSDSSDSDSAESSDPDPKSKKKFRPLYLRLKHDLQFCEEEVAAEHTCAVFSCAWMPYHVDDGAVECAQLPPPVLAAVGEHGVRVWKAKGERFELVASVAGYAACCEWSAKGEYLAVGGSKAEVTIWEWDNTANKLTPYNFFIPKSKEETKSVSWKQYPKEDYYLLLCGTKDGYMALYKVRLLENDEQSTFSRIAWWEDKRCAPLMFIKWKPGSYHDFFLYGGFHGLELMRVDIVDKNTGISITRITDVHGGPEVQSAYGITFNCDDKDKFFTWGTNGQLECVSIEVDPCVGDGELRWILHWADFKTEFSGTTVKKMINDVDWTSYGRIGTNYMAVGHQDRSILLLALHPEMKKDRFYDFYTRGMVLDAHKESVNCVRWYRGGQDGRLRLASASKDGTVKVWYLVKLPHGKESRTVDGKPWRK